MNFSEAFELMKQGKRIRRKSFSTVFDCVFIDSGFVYVGDVSDINYHQEPTAADLQSWLFANDWEEAKE